MFEYLLLLRNWGVASLPGDRGTIDVGINSHGLVNAFAPDIADLSLAEQAYWASFSSLPSGEICEELFQTRMQQNPPNSPGVVDLIREARSQLNSVFQNPISTDLFSGIEPSEQELRRLSVGAIGNQFTEVLDLAKILYGWVIETMRVDPLRNTLISLGGTVDNKLRQIKLLEKILVTKGLDQTQARIITAPLVGLNELRIGSAHIGNPELEPAFQSPKQKEEIVEQFLTSWNQGDLHTLIALMAEDITFWSDGGGQVTAAQRPLQGCQKVARFLVAIRRSRLIPILNPQLVQINDQPGILNIVGRVPQSTFSFDFSGQSIQSIFAVVNPEKLKGVKL